MSKLLGTVDVVAQRLNQQLRLTGVVVCMNEPSTKLAKEVRNDAESFFTAVEDPRCPWQGAKIFDTTIRRNIRLAEAPSFGESIFEYAPHSNGAQDYRLLAEEILDKKGTTVEAEAAEENSGAGETSLWSFRPLVQFVATLNSKGMEPAYRHHRRGVPIRVALLEVRRRTVRTHG